MTALTFVGAWHLVTQIMRHADGTLVYPRGKQATGQLIYTSDGQMSVQLNRDHNTTHLDLASENTALSGFLAYYGAYTVDIPNRVITHHVAGCSYAPWVGNDLVRRFGFSHDGGVLTLTGEWEGSQRILTWQRHAD